MLVAFVRDLFGGRHEGLGLPQIQDRVPVVLLLDDARDDVALASGVFAEGLVALRFAKALQDDLLEGLGCDTSEVFGRVLPFLDDRVVVSLVLELDVLREHRDAARLGIDDRARSPSLIGVGHAQVCRREALLHRLDEGFLRYASLPYDIAQRVHWDLHVNSIRIRFLPI
jgi:hypothetical protein